MDAITCKRCNARKALPTTDSVLVLCQRCTDAVFPGSDATKYKQLISQYGR